MSSISTCGIKEPGISLRKGCLGREDIRKGGIHRETLLFARHQGNGSWYEFEEMKAGLGLHSAGFCAIFSGGIREAGNWEIYRLVDKETRN